MPQHRRRDINERGTAVVDSWDKAAPGDEQKRMLLVGAEATMLAKAGAVLRFERIADDVAVARHAVRISALVGPERQGDLQCRMGRQTDLGKGIADECPADPVLGFEKLGDL